VDGGNPRASQSLPALSVHFEPSQVPNSRRGSASGADAMELTGMPEGVSGVAKKCERSWSVTSSSIGEIALLSGLARNASRHLDAGGPSIGEIDEEGVKTMLRTGRSMLRNPCVPRWMDGRNKSPQRKGEDMLREQDALDDRDRFLRLVSHSEWKTMHSHMARNIRARLEDEPDKDTTLRECRHRSANIRKDLSTMAGARRELYSVKERMRFIVNEGTDLDKRGLHDRSMVQGLTQQYKDRTKVQRPTLLAPGDFAPNPSEAANARHRRTVY
jgi:hypothetical protein